MKKKIQTAEQYYKERFNLDINDLAPKVRQLINGYYLKNLPLHPRHIKHAIFMNTNLAWHPIHTELGYLWFSLLLRGK